MEFLERVLSHLNLIVMEKKKKKNQPLLVSNFAICRVILEILFKKNQVERNKHFVNKAWLSWKIV